MAVRSRLFSHNTLLTENFSILSQTNYVIVLLDIYSDDQRLRETLAHIPGCDYTRTITVNQCLELVNNDDMKSAILILIISKRFVGFVQEKLLRILPKVSYIYSFDGVRCNDDLLSDRRYRGSFDCVQPLADKIKIDIELARQKNELNASGFEILMENSAEFLWHRFFVNILHHLKNTDVAKCEMIQALRKFYSDSLAELHKIDQLEKEYRADQSIYWYTREDGFPLPLNLSLRNSDINEIFSLRIVIQDLHEEVRKVRTAQIHERQLIVYRCQVMHIDHIERLRQTVAYPGFFNHWANP